MCGCNENINLGGIAGDQGVQGIQGIQGIQGNGVVSTAWTSNSGTQPQGTQGTTDTYTITFTDATTDTFTVYNGANGTNSQVSGFTHYLGEPYLGGIIYYLYKGSDGLEHGLVVSLTQALGHAWQTTGLFTVTGADRTEDGIYNTVLMTNSPVATYIATLGAGWYLPSNDEILILFDNRFHVQKSLRSGGNTLITSVAGYWTSTEFDTNNAYAFSSSGNTFYQVAKNGGIVSRGIKAF